MREANILYMIVHRHEHGHHEHQSLEPMWALPHREVAGTISGSGRRGRGPGRSWRFEFFVLTAARSGAVRGALWAKWTRRPTCGPSRPLE